MTEVEVWLNLLELFGEIDELEDKLDFCWAEKHKLLLLNFYFLQLTTFTLLLYYFPNNITTIYKYNLQLIIKSIVINI